MRFMCVNISLFYRYYNSRNFKCVPIWYLFCKNDIFAKLNRMKMVVVSSREFRANQRKYFDLALTNDVVITSRSHGSYRLVPVRESDTIIDQTTLETKIRRGIEEYEQGKVHRMEEGESVDGFLSRMINED